MNFHPTDYLTNLNLDFENPAFSPSVAGNSPDLDLFQQIDFLDFDVFSKDASLPTKQAFQPAEVAQPVFANNNNNNVAPYIKQEPQTVEFLQIQPSSSPETFSPGESGAQTSDKRRRNTAASARFRIKKKLREQQMENDAKQLQERLQALEKKLKTLEMENKCLKSLIMQKNEQTSSDLLEGIKKRSIADSSSLFEYTR